MAGSCARALELGLPAIAFPEHLDHTVGRIASQGPYVMDHLTAIAAPDGLLVGVATMMSTSGMFSVLAHIDYPVRSWPQERVGVFDPKVFEEEFRHALRATAQSGRALEINTRLPLHAAILSWWHEEGGDAVTFGSDAPLPPDVAHGFADAAQMAEAHGFRSGANPYDLWSRVD